MNIAAHIKENMVLNVGQNKVIIYGWITNAITITCLLNDGSKVGAHIVLFGYSGKVLIKKIKKIINTRKVIKVIVVGNGSYWGPELQDQIDIAAMARRVWSPVTGIYEHVDLTYEQLKEKMDLHIINNNENKFKMWLETNFDALNIQFKNIDKKTFVFLDKSGNPCRSNVLIEKL